MTKFTSALAKMTIISLALFATNSFAQVVQYNGAGSSAMFNTFGFAARLGASPVCGKSGVAHNWSKKNGASAHDSRSSSIGDVTGNIWIVWDNSTAPTVILSLIHI